MSLLINEDFRSKSRHEIKITAPVRSAGPTGQAGIYFDIPRIIF